MKIKPQPIGDGWHQVAALGEFWHGSQKVWQIVDRASVEAQAAAFKPGDKLLVGIDHYEDLDDGEKAKLREIGILLPSNAVGWVSALQARADGLWGRVEWTGEGLRLIESGEYRFLSPVWRQSDCAELDKSADGNRRVRPLKLARASLTNEPGIRDNKPLSNRDLDGAPVAIAEVTQQTPKGKPMKSIALKLGLPEDADEATILAAIAKLQGQNTDMCNRLQTAEADVFLAKHAKRIKTDDQKDKLRKAFLANRESAEDLASMIPESQPAPADRPPLTNRETASAPDGSRKEKVYANRLEAFADMPEGSAKDKFQNDHAAELLDLQRKAAK